MRILNKIFGGCNLCNTYSYNDFCPSLAGIVAAICLSVSRCRHFFSASCFLAKLICSICFIQYAVIIRNILGFVGISGMLILGWTITGFCNMVTIYNPNGSIATYTTTIQAGVDVCPVGGTVSVAAGTYTEAVYINKGIALIGAGSDSTTITAPEFDRANTVTFVGTTTNNASISGFRITGATDQGIGCRQSSPTITNNIISWNRGNGICCNSSSPSITNNIIMTNSNGIYCDSSSPSITNNIIVGNSGDGITCAVFVYLPIINNTILRNTFMGINCDSSSFPSITNNTISGNSGNGISCGSFVSPTIINNIITGNGISNYCGISVYPNYSPIIDYNCVWWNGLSTTHNYSNCSAGSNDISADPQFIGGGDFHLGSFSHCIDKGSNIAPAIPSTDKDGNPRIIRIVDMGAYEYKGIPNDNLHISAK
ncbi:MAG: right-handed parallel beta-helix repeat-containing protein [bacterium]